MTKEELISQLDRAASSLAGLPVTSAMAAFLSAELKTGDPAWWKHTLKAWEKREFVAWGEAWTLFIACVHFDALNDVENPLRPYFPTCGGTDEADPANALGKFLREPPQSFFDNLKTRQRRAYSPLRASLWMSPAALFFQPRELPFYAVELNTGAGLNLATNLLYPLKGFDETLVSARVGLDFAPLLLEDIFHRRWLQACLFPENMEGIGKLDAAADKLIEAKGRDPSFLQLAQCEAKKGPKFIAKNIPAEEDIGLLVLNMGTTVRMTDQGYVDFSEDMAKTMGKWGDRALWIEVESVRGEIFSTTHQLLAHKIVGGKLEHCIVGRIDLQAQEVQENPKAKEFLFTKS